MTRRGHGVIKSIRNLSEASESAEDVIEDVLLSASSTTSYAVPGASDTF